MPVDFSSFSNWFGSLIGRVRRTKWRVYNMNFEFWPYQYLWLFSWSLCWGGDSFPNGLFFFPVGHSFETVMGSSDKVSWVRDIQIIMILLQALWFVDQELCQHATLGHIPTHHSLVVWHSDPSFIVWHSEPLFTVKHLKPPFLHSLAFKAIIHNQTC